MPSPAEGAVGSLDYTKEERRKLAERSRREVPEFGASPERRELVRRVHAAMMRKWEVSQVSLRKGQNNFSEKNAEDAEEKESDEVSDDASVADGDGSAAAASDATTERLNETSVATNANETNATLAATLGSLSADALLTRPETLNPSAGPSEEGAREGALGVRASPEAEKKPSEEGADEDEAKKKKRSAPRAGGRKKKRTLRLSDGDHDDCATRRVGERFNRRSRWRRVFVGRAVASLGAGPGSPSRFLPDCARRRDAFFRRKRDERLRLRRFGRLWVGIGFGGTA
jgi:hypothetical protein